MKEKTLNLFVLSRRFTYPSKTETFSLDRKHRYSSYHYDDDECNILLFDLFFQQPSMHVNKQFHEKFIQFLSSETKFPLLPSSVHFGYTHFIGIPLHISLAALLKNDVFGIEEFEAMKYNSWRCVLFWNNWKHNQLDKHLKKSTVCQCLGSRTLDQEPHSASV